MKEQRERRTGIGHPHIDKRSLERHRLVVERTDADPSLMNVAHENLARWERTRGTLPKAHQEWKLLLNSRTWLEIRTILLEDSDEGQRPRSSAPLVGIATQEKWERIIEENPPPVTRRNCVGRAG